MKFKILFTILVVLGAGFFLYQEAPRADFQNFFGDRDEIQVEDRQTETEEAADEESIVNQELPSLPKTPGPKPVAPKEVSTPGPLKSPIPPPLTSSPASSSPASVGLTSGGIILETNVQRQQNGLGALSSKDTLNAMALSKANDMCGNQYFTHVSPSGAGAGDLADSFGYDYIAIGENLAYGPFSSNAAVVEAWMASPGHRANMLNSKFTEMGAAAAMCFFQGKSTWLAVQHFGKPAALCSRPDAALRRTIDENKAVSANMRDRLIDLRREIEASGAELEPGYNDKVDFYNSFVKQYNALIVETRDLISQYNSQVIAYNTCASN